MQFPSSVKYFLKSRLSAKRNKRKSREFAFLRGLEMGREKINLWKSVWARFVVGKSTMQLQRNLSFWVVVPLFENGFELCRCSNIRDLISEYIWVSFTRYSPSIEHVWWIFQSATIFIREKLSLIHRWSLNIWNNFDHDVWHNRSKGD